MLFALTAFYVIIQLSNTGGNLKMSNKVTEFFQNAFEDMKESAKAQHEVDKANFAAVKAESKAQWEEARAMANPEKRKAMLQSERDIQIEEAKNLWRI